MYKGAAIFFTIFEKIRRVFFTNYLYNGVFFINKIVNLNKCNSTSMVLFIISEFQFSDFKIKFTCLCKCYKNCYELILLH